MLAQTHDRLQVVVVDGGSRDATVSIVRARATRDPRVQLLQNAQGAIPRSLNMAADVAQGRWLVRVDAHSTVPPTYVTQAVGHLQRSDWGGVGGRKEGVGETPAGRAIAAAMASRFGVGDSTYHYATTSHAVDHIPFGAYPVDVVREVGGWDESLVANEDFEFDYRVRSSGHALLLDPQMSIRWRSRQSIPDVFGQYRRYGRGKVDVARKHPRSLQPRHLLPPALIGYGTVALVLAWRRPVTAAVMVSPYAIGLAVASVLTGRKLSSPEDRRWVPAAFVAMHVGWGLGFWEGVLGAAPRAASPDSQPASSPPSRRWSAMTVSSSRTTPGGPTSTARRKPRRVRTKPERSSSIRSRRNRMSRPSG